MGVHLSLQCCVVSTHVSWLFYMVTGDLILDPHDCRVGLLTKTLLQHPLPSFVSLVADMSCFHHVFNDIFPSAFLYDFLNHGDYIFHPITDII